jgi:hypothetical protein
MQYIDNLLEKRNMSQMMLVVLFIIYLVMGLKMPDPLANAIDSPAGKIVVALLALMLFGYSNPILGVLGIMVAYHLITPTHQFPYTLEQEVVKQMASQKFNANYVKAPYRPMLDDTHDASLID